MAKIGAPARWCALSALSLKYLQLELPDHIHNWLMDYFTGRGHSTRVAGLSSLVARINESIIQGSRLSPSSYVVAASDLHPKHRQNKITKFADDTYLLVGAIRWADSNYIFFHHLTFYWQGMQNLYTGSSNILTKYEVPRINFRGATAHLNIWSRSEEHT